MAYGTRRHNAAFIHKGSPIISCAKSTQFLVLIPISLRSILILSSNLRLGLLKGIFPVGLPVKILKVLLPSYILATMPCPSHHHYYYYYYYYYYYRKLPEIVSNLVLDKREF